MTQETLRFIMMAAVFSLALFGFSVLAGCESAKDTSKFLECYARDISSNPCN